MKQRDLIKRLELAGFKFLRHGSDHDQYARGKEMVSVPRHREIKENLAKSITRKYRL